MTIKVYFTHCQEWQLNIGSFINKLLCQTEMSFVKSSKAIRVKHGLQNTISLVSRIFWYDIILILKWALYSNGAPLYNLRTLRQAERSTDVERYDTRNTFA